ncbi:unnamed protein product, partial [Brassica oleracea]
KRGIKIKARAFPKWVCKKFHHSLVTIVGVDFYAGKFFTDSSQLQQARELDQSTQVYSSLQPEMGSLLVRWEPLTSTLSLSLSATVSLPSHVSAAGSLYAKRGGPG